MKCSNTISCYIWIKRRVWENDYLGILIDVELNIITQRPRSLKSHLVFWTRSPGFGPTGGQPQASLFRSRGFLISQSNSWIEHAMSITGHRAAASGPLFKTRSFYCIHRREGVMRHLPLLMGNIENGESKDISEGVRFETRLVHRIASLRFFMVFLSCSKQDISLMGTQLFYVLLTVHLRSQ